MQADWAATVVEVTESLELTLRGRQLRGELWMLQRADQANKFSPVVGVLLESRAPGDVPAAFDIRPPLFHLYHATDLALGVPNPLPRRLSLPAAQLPPPPTPEVFGLADPPRPTESNRESLRRLIPKGARAAYEAQPRSNGHEQR